jgi:hypothetical protein
LSTAEIGYIPAENIETPFEKLARLNRHRNVDVTNVQNDDIRSIPAKKKTVKIQFAEYHTEIYADGDESEKDDVVTEYEMQAHIQPKKKQSFLGKFFKPKSKKEPKPQQEPQPELLPKGSIESITSERTVDTVQSHSAIINAMTPINVLRIYPGNITLNTMFKSVSYDKDTIISSLILHSLKKFRVTNLDTEQYYMTVTPVDEFGASIQKGNYI